MSNSRFSSLVLVDDFFIEKKLRILISGFDGNWNVLCLKKALTLLSKNNGLDDGNRPAWKINMRGFDSIAKNSKDIFLAFPPDEHGHYLSSVLYRYLKRHLKIAVPIYRISFPTLNEDCVYKAFISARTFSKNINLVNSYEARFSVNRLVCGFCDDLFYDILPFSPNLGMHTLYLLDVVESFSCDSLRIKIGDYVMDCPVPKKEFKNGDSSISIFDVKHRRLAGVSLESVLFKMSLRDRIVDFNKKLSEAYGSGFVTWPASSVSCYAPKNLDVCGGFETSSDSYGMCCMRGSENFLLDILPDVVFLSDGLKEEYKIRIGVKDPFSVPLYLYADSGSVSLGSRVTVLGKASYFGCPQNHILRSLKDVGFKAKLWSYLLYSMVRSKYLEYVTDTDVCITSLGRLVLELGHTWAPSLLDRSFLKKSNSLLDSVIRDDDDYSEVVDRIEEHFIDGTADKDDIHLPELRQSCPRCGSSLRMNVNSDGVFASCRNARCENKSAVLNVTFKDGEAVVENPDD